MGARLRVPAAPLLRRQQRPPITIDIREKTQKEKALRKVLIGDMRRIMYRKQHSAKKKALRQMPLTSPVWVLMKGWNKDRNKASVRLVFN